MQLDFYWWLNDWFPASEINERAIVNWRRLIRLSWNNWRFMVPLSLWKLLSRRMLCLFYAFRIHRTKNKSKPRLLISLECTRTKLAYSKWKKLYSKLYERRSQQWIQKAKKQILTWTAYRSHNSKLLESRQSNNSAKGKESQGAIFS